MIVLKVRKANSFTHYGDLQLIPEVVRYPHFEVPYPQLKRGQQSLGALVAVVRSSRYIYFSLEKFCIKEILIFTFLGTGQTFVDL